MTTRKRRPVLRNGGSSPRQPIVQGFCWVCGLPTSKAMSAPPAYGCCENRSPIVDLGMSSRARFIPPARIRYEQSGSRNAAGMPAESVASALDGGPAPESIARPNQVRHVRIWQMKSLLYGRAYSKDLYDPARPCWKCGSRAFDKIRFPSLLYWTARILGLRLCECSGCHRFRLVRRRRYDNRASSLSQI